MHVHDLFRQATLQWHPHLLALDVCLLLRDEACLEVKVCSSELELESVRGGLICAQQHKKKFCAHVLGWSSLWRVKYYTFERKLSIIQRLHSLSGVFFIGVFIQGCQLITYQCHWPFVAILFYVGEQPSVGSSTSAPVTWGTRMRS